MSLPRAVSFTSLSTDLCVAAACTKRKITLMFTAAGLEGDDPQGRLSPHLSIPDRDWEVEQLVQALMLCAAF